MSNSIILPSNINPEYLPMWVAVSKGEYRPEPILEFRENNRWLSNFEICDIPYEGVVYPSTEHAYQASKTLSPKARKAISQLPKPTMAMHVGRALIYRPDWDDIKLRVMRDVNLLKFRYHDYLQILLLATGNEHLEEGNRWGDVFWGTCDGKGENNLGKILMEIRNELRS